MQGGTTAHAMQAAPCILDGTVEHFNHYMLIIECLGSGCFT